MSRKTIRSNQNNQSRANNPFFSRDFREGEMYPRPKKSHKTVKRSPFKQKSLQRVNAIQKIFREQREKLKQKMEEEKDFYRKDFIKKAKEYPEMPDSVKKGVVVSNNLPEFKEPKFWPQGKKTGKQVNGGDPWGVGGAYFEHGLRVARLEATSMPNMKTLDCDFYEKINRVRRRQRRKMAELKAAGRAPKTLVMKDQGFEQKK